MIKKLTLAAAAIGALTGCFGKDICDKGKKNADKCDYTYTDADLDACKTGLKSCSGSEKKTLNDYYSCLDDAGFFECPADGSGTTSGATDGTDGAALISCATGLVEVSQECLATLVGSSGSSSSYTTSTF